jgi:hypothetical protein
MHSFKADQGSDGGKRRAINQRMRGIFRSIPSLLLLFLCQTLNEWKKKLLRLYKQIETLR